MIGRANRRWRRGHRHRHDLPGCSTREPALAAKATITGNPVRPTVLAAAASPYAAPAPAGVQHLLITGGSQGARVMADLVPPAIERLEPQPARARLTIVQQAREEDMTRVARRLCAAQRQGRARAVLRRPAGAHRRRASGDRPAPAPRQWPSSRPSAGRRSWCRCRSALDQDQLANADRLAQRRRRRSC